MNTPTGLLLIGHGTRDRRGRGEALQLAELLAEMLPHVPVELGFLELCEPTIDDAAEALLARGVEQIRVMPLLLFAAGHAKRDIPQIVAGLEKRHAGLQVDVASPLGCDARILELSRLRFHQSWQEQDPEQPDQDPSRVLLLLVGRGSDDPEAIAELRRFGRLRAEAEGLGGVQTCFCSLAEPNLPAGLAASAAAGFPQVVVQPHLLLAGRLLDRVRRVFGKFVSAGPPGDWRLAQHLGPHKLVATAVLNKTGLLPVVEP